MSAKRTVFNKLWLDDPEFAVWLKEVKGSAHDAFCAVCKTTFSLSNMGKQAVKSHASSAKHLKQVNAPKVHVYTMDEFMKAGLTVNQASSSVSIIPEIATSSNEDQSQPLSGLPSDNLSEASVSNVEHPEHITLPIIGLNKYVTTDQVTTAEIIWALKCVTSHYSLNSSKDVKEVFQLMFPDSNIARKITLGSTKMSYILTFGLAPYFHNNLLRAMLESAKVTVCFDEAFNRISQRGQMDITVKFWNNNTNQVSSRYFGSSFMGHASADCVLQSFKEAVKEIPLEKMLQVGMDGPAVNWKFIDLLETDLTETKLLNLGSCGLHTIHGAFQTGHKASGWNVNGYLRAMHVIFRDSPARRADYIHWTESSRFPYKFCQIRWVENVKVAERALEVLPNVRKFVDNSKKLPNSITSTTIQALCADKLAGAKIAFFASVGSEFEIFLKKYQTPSPLGPFLYDDIAALTRSLMNRFVKKSILKEVTSVTQLVKLDLTVRDNLCQYKEIDIGVSATRQLGNAKLTDTDKITFRMNCMEYLKAAVTKIIEKSPLKHSIVRAISCLVPETIVSSPTLAEKRLKELVQILFDSSHITATVADKCKSQFTELLTKASGALKTKFKEFSRSNSRLDEFYYSIIGDNESFSDLFAVVKIVLTLSHGNSDVESGFSINSDMLVENLHEDSLVAQRTVYDAIKTAGGVSGVAIDKNMLMYVRASHRRYTEALEHKKQAENEEKKAVAAKRRVSDEIKQLKGKKQKLEKEAAAECNRLDLQINDLMKTCNK